MLLSLVLEGMEQSLSPVVYPGIFFSRGSTNSVEDREQTEWGFGGIAP